MNITVLGWTSALPAATVKYSLAVRAVNTGALCARDAVKCYLRGQVAGYRGPRQSGSAEEVQGRRGFPAGNPHLPDAEWSP